MAELEITKVEVHHAEVPFKMLLWSDIPPWNDGWRQFPRYEAEYEDFFTDDGLYLPLIVLHDNEKGRHESVQVAQIRF